MRFDPRPTAVRSYLRVSTPGQEREGTSLEGQETAHRRFCLAHGLPQPVLYIEVESGADTSIEKRDEQLRLQREAQAGELVLVTVLDRWSRDVPHAVSTVRALVCLAAFLVGWAKERLEAEMKAPPPPVAP